MKLCILLLLIVVSLLYARETSLTYKESSLYQTDSRKKTLLTYSYFFTDHSFFKEPPVVAHSQALHALKPKPKAFKVDYGNGVLTTKLEQATLVLLEYDWIANIVYTLSDDFHTNRPKRRARVLLNVNNNEFKFIYSI